MARKFTTDPPSIKSLNYVYYPKIFSEIKKVKIAPLHYVRLAEQRGAIYF